MKDNIIIENKFSYDFNHLKNPRKFGDLLLYQLGEIYCNNSAVVEPHIHNDFFELTYIISGMGIVYAGNLPTEVKKTICLSLSPTKDTKSFPIRSILYDITISLSASKREPSLRKSSTINACFLYRRPAVHTIFPCWDRPSSSSFPPWKTIPFTPISNLNCS